jgi:hypothetical protein
LLQDPLDGLCCPGAGCGVRSALPVVVGFVASTLQRDILIPWVGGVNLSSGSLCRWRGRRCLADWRWLRWLRERGLQGLFLSALLLQHDVHAVWFRGRGRQGHITTGDRDFTG